MNKSTLRATAAEACKHIDIGTAVLPKPLINDPEYERTLRTEFNAIVVEHHMKWAPLCQGLPGPLLDGMESDRVPPLFFGISVTVY